MSITVTPNLTTIDVADSTGWTLTDGSTGYGALDTVSYIQGTGCLGVQVKASTVIDINYVPPQVEVITISVGSGLSQEEHDKLFANSTVSDVNNAVIALA